MSKTHNIFIAEVNALHGQEYEILSLYSGAMNKVKIKHTTCLHEYEASPNNLLKGRRCPECFGIKKYEFDFVKKYIESFNYQFVECREGYINNRSKISVICPNGHDRIIDFKHFKKGIRCIVCMNKESGKKRRLTHEEVECFLEDINFKLLSPYIKSSDKIFVECPNGHQSYMLLTNLKKGQGCFDCKVEHISEFYKLPLK